MSLNKWWLKLEIKDNYYFNVGYFNFCNNVC